MAVQMKPDSPIKAAISVSGQCRLLRMSRSQFYFHVKRGTFHAPLYLASNNRPYFTASMAEDNIKAREIGVGVNGEYILFYERVATGTKAESTKPKDDLTGLLEGLKASGLKTMTPEQVEAALTVCFPGGTSGQNENSVLTVVFKHLKRSGVV
ncbi:hypothetical protein BH11PLA2_BH11PLA2_16170 [soil metagenome]